MREELSRLELEVDPWFSLSELRLAPDGRKVLIPHARQKKPEVTKVDIKDCVFCPNQRDRLKQPYFLTDLIQEMKDKSLYILENEFPSVTPPPIADKQEKLPPAPVYLVDRKIAIGRHLVMIESLDHHLNSLY